MSTLTYLKLEHIWGCNTFCVVSFLDINLGLSAFSDLLQCVPIPGHAQPINVIISPFCGRSHRRYIMSLAGFWCVHPTFLCPKFTTCSISNTCQFVPLCYGILIMSQTTEMHSISLTNIGQIPGAGGTPAVVSFSPMGVWWLLGKNAD